MTFSDFLKKVLGCKEQEYLENYQNAQVEITRLKEEPSIKKQFDDKYPKADISYSGRTLPNSNTMTNVPVTILITPTDYQIKNDLKKWGLDKISNEDDLVKIYKKIKEFYKYAYDQASWGKEEIWEFPFETRNKISTGADCDSWAIFQASYYISAGFPNYKVRVTAGMCGVGGHATVYVYSEKDSKWHHLNSTYGVMFDKLVDFPTHEDAESKKDVMGIFDVWFSFNNEYAWHEFSTTSAGKSFKKFKDERIKIGPI